MTVVLVLVDACAHTHERRSDSPEAASVEPPPLTLKGLRLGPGIRPSAVYIFCYLRTVCISNWITNEAPLALDLFVNNWSGLGEHGINFHLRHNSLATLPLGPMQLLLVPLTQKACFAGSVHVSVANW